MTSFLSTEKTKSTAFLRLNRPAALNALTLEMIRGLAWNLSAWEADSDIHGIVICSNTPKAFCAGGDIHFFYKASLVKDVACLGSFFTEEYALIHRIHHYPKPYIAVLDGIVMGGGMGISQNSAFPRIRIVTERTRMAMPEVNIGLFPDVGGGYFLSRLPSEIGTYLALTGEIINTADALFVGLADIFIPSDELPQLFATLKIIDGGDYRTPITKFSERYKRWNQTEKSLLEQHQDLIQKHFSGTRVQDIIESLKQDPHPFAKRTAETMLKRSPLMLCVTLEQLRRAKTIPFSDCLRMERTMMHHCFEHGDVMEGIRAAIIDKDNQPHWQPASLKEITDEMIARFFEPVWPDHAHPLIGLK